MAQSGGIKRKFLGANEGDVDLLINGIIVEIRTNGSVTAYTNGEVKKHPITAGLLPEIGGKMPDGTIYAGISPITRRAMYTMPEDSPLNMAFNEAAQYVGALVAHGHRDWRMPSVEEAGILLQYCDTGVAGLDNYDYASKYWCAQPGDYQDYLCVMQFHDRWAGTMIRKDENTVARVRPMRCDP